MKYTEIFCVRVRYIRVFGRNPGTQYTHTVPEAKNRAHTRTSLFFLPQKYNKTYKSCEHIIISSLTYRTGAGSHQTPDYIHIRYTRILVLYRTFLIVKVNKWHRRIFSSRVEAGKRYTTNGQVWTDTAFTPHIGASSGWQAQDLS